MTDTWGVEVYDDHIREWEIDGNVVTFRIIGHGGGQRHYGIPFALTFEAE